MPLLFMTISNFIINELCIISQIPTLAQVGGKDLSLMKMANAGLPVPLGFVLTTEAYDTFVREYGLHDQITDLIS